MSILLNKDKILILLNPKCATRTLLEIFSNKMDVTDKSIYNFLYKKNDTDHLSFDQIKNYLTNFNKLDAYKVYIPIRNPYDRLISLYLFFRQLDSSKVQKKYLSLFNTMSEYCNKNNFNNFISNVFNENINYISTFKIENMIGQCDAQNVNFLKIENLKEDLNKFNLHKSNIPTLNKAIRDNCSYLIEQDNIKKIQETFSRDFEIGCYEKNYSTR